MWPLNQWYDYDMILVHICMKCVTWNYVMEPCWIWQVRYVSPYLPMRYDEYDSMIWNDIWHDTRKEKYEKDMKMMHSAFAYDVRAVNCFL